MNPRAFELLRIGLILDEHFQRASDERLRYLHGDFVLRSHCQGASLLPDAVSDLAGHFSGAGAFLLRVGEDAESLEPGFLDEIAQRFKARFGLAWKADN